MVRRKVGEEDDDDGDEEAEQNVHQHNDSERKLEKLSGKFNLLDKPRRVSGHKKSEDKEKQPSLFCVLLRCYGWDFTIAGVFKLLSDILDFIKPQILGYVLQNFFFVRYLL